MVSSFVEVAALGSSLSYRDFGRRCHIRDIPRPGKQPRGDYGGDEMLRYGWSNQLKTWLSFQQHQLARPSVSSRGDIPCRTRQYCAFAWRALVVQCLAAALFISLSLVCERRPRIGILYCGTRFDRDSRVDNCEGVVARPWTGTMQPCRAVWIAGRARLAQ